jgi:transglutaminase-like putative cysteine protease
MGLVFGLVRSGIYTPMKGTSFDLPALTVYYLGLLGMVVLILKIYKLKRPRELYTSYVISLGLFIVSSLFAPWKWDTPNAILFSIFAASSILFFLDLVVASHPAAGGSAPFAKGRFASLYVSIAVVIALCTTFSKVSKDYEPRALEMMARMMSSATFYSFPSTSSLGRMESLFQSRKVTMNVYTGRSLSRIRGRAYNQYDRGAWSTAAPAARLVALQGPARESLDRLFPRREDAVYLLAPDRPGTPPDGLQKERYVIHIRKNGLLYHPPGSVAAALPRGDFSRDNLGNVQGAFASLLEYELAVTPMPPPGQGGMDSPPGDADVAMPGSIREKFKAEAGRITGGTLDPYRAAAAIERHLQENYKYNLGIKLTRPDMDPVEEFLFLGRPAHCEYFASAMALLLRSMGIPARYGVGFMAGEYNRPAGCYVVREMDAHAWVLAYIPGRGWVEFDPTPPAGRPERAGREGTDWLEFLRARGHDLFRLLRAGEWKELLAGLLSTLKMLVAAGWIPLLLALAAFLLLRYRGRLGVMLAAGKKHDGSPRPFEGETAEKLQGLMGRFDSLMAGKGFVRPLHLTLCQYADYLEEKWAGDGSHPGEFLRDYSRIRYGGRPGREDIASLEKSLDRIFHPSP